MKKKLFLFRVLIILAIALTLNSAPDGYAKNSVQDSPQANLELVDHWGGLSGKVKVSGNYAYLGQAEELAIIDISDPTDLRRVGFIMLPGNVGGLEIKDNLLFAGWGGCSQDLDEYNCVGGVKVFEIQPSAVLNEIGAFDLPGASIEITINGDVAYVLWEARNLDFNWGRLDAYDISNPAQPVMGGSNWVDWEPKSFELGNGYGYLTDDHYLHVLDLTDALNPVRVNKIGLGWDAIAVSGDYVFDARAIFRTYSLVDPVNPMLVASVEIDESSQAIVLKDGYAFLAEASDLSSHGGLRIMDVSDPAAPVQTGHIALGYRAVALALQGNIAYVSMMYSGLVAVDVSDPTQPVVVGKYLAPGEAAQAVRSNNRLFVTLDLHKAGASGLWTAELSGGVDPAGRGFFEYFHARNLAVEGNTAYMLRNIYDGGGFDNRVRVVDASDPANPVGRGAYLLPRDVGASDVATKDGFVYVTRGPQLHILDARNPDSVQPAAIVALQGGRPGVALSGDYAYVANGGALSVFDVRNPAQPLEVGGCDLTGSVWYLAVSGGYAYVSGGGLLRVVDVSNPAAPQEISSLKAPSDVYDIDAEGPYAFLASFYGGLRVIDARNPAHPFEIAFFTPARTTLGVDVDNGHVYLAAAQQGVYIFRFSPLANNVYLPLVH